MAAKLLQDKIALITGAGRGLGQSVALAYGRQGAQVIAIARTQSELNRTARLIQAKDGLVWTLAVDVAQENQVRHMAAQVLDRFGRLDVLVNNAARLPLKPFEKMTMQDWDRTLAVNLRAPALITKLFLDSMKVQDRGSVINVSSAAGVKGFELETDYCASKFALEGFSRALALELKRYNIAVNTITPGGLTGQVKIKPTSMTQAEFDALSQDERSKWHDPIVLTESFVYLALQDANGVTGQRIYAYDLSAQIRQEGWKINYEPVE